MRGALRSARRIAVVALIAIVVLVAVGVPVYVFPATDAVPARADAVLVLGPPTRARTDLGRELVEEGVADTLLISVWASELAAAPDESDVVACDEPDMTVICFTAEPGTTQGEARALRDYADANGWDTVLVITQTPHITRARILMERCWGGTVLMESSGEPFTLGDWAYEYAYQTGAFAKVLVEQGC
ncbi:YdcF family protein [Rathayibacter sp. VKM Ac-2803]|uniref:ElyC/SanA/YdcF family protein n=1 Tax=unclassified Rathayibacter TaxID=2609250 RepID=UPI00135AE9CE|nr:MULTISPECIES: ElyC/SanA/YdcF family protein [unclassified Rathayibacter]MWV48997.1 YdcF family protein [Rathayibacter sp. VKM Ac-2803]MWV58511.1 YdcF family protein [Rathayibacter sp. VKM Ac-2754]